MGCLCDWQIEREIRIEPFTRQQESKGVVSYGLSSMGYDARVGYKFKVFTNVHSTVVDVKAFDERAFVDVDLSPQKHLWKHDRDDGQFECGKCHKTCHTPEQFMNRCVDVPNFVLIPPNSFALGESVETFTIPRDVLAVCVGKSTYARAGIVVNVTPLEAEWTGKVTIEISNTTPLPAKIYAGEGVMQVLFLRADGYRAINSASVYRLAKVLYESGDLTGNCPEELLAVMKRYEIPNETRDASCRVSYADKKGRYNHQLGLTLPFVKKEE